MAKCADRFLKRSDAVFFLKYGCLILILIFGFLYDFDLGTWVFARDEEVETIIEFVKQNLDATTSEITDFRIWCEDCLDGEFD